MNARHLADYLEASAARFPDRTAVVDPAGSGSTYAELNREADSLARFLVASGVKRGDRVGVVLPKGRQAVVAFFGIMKAGAAYVPVDYRGPVERARQILADCEIRALIVDGRLLDVISPPLTAKGPLAAVIVVGSISNSAQTEQVTPYELAIEGRAAPFSCERDPGDLAYIIYTSGSTGMPKGAMITHGNALSFVEWCSSLLKPTETDRFSGHTPFHFDPSVVDIYCAVKHGASLHLIPEELAKRSKDLALFIAEHRLTIWTSTPSALIMLVQFGNLEAYGPSSLRVVSFGGEVFPIKHLRALQRHWPEAVYYNMYGPTETTTISVFARIPAVIPDNRDAPYPIGFPCSHCRALVLNDEGQEVGAGEEGLLYISGPSVFAGYWNRPTETAAVFLNRGGVRWYNTGDVVRWDPVEGMTFVGRNDGMVKRRGFRIELGEIESALYSHASVSEAAVLSIPDGDSGVKIVAFLTCHSTTRPSVVDVKTFCARKLPAYMSPDALVFQDTLPRTSTGKVDYQALKAQLLASSAG